MLKAAKKNQLVDARMLAEFANLEESQLDHFRNAVSRGFVPDSFWNGLVFSGSADTPHQVWKAEQQRLREAWRVNFEPDICVELIANTAKYSEQGQRLRQLNQMLEMGNAEVLELMKQEFPPTKAYPYQHAVMLLALQPWRARVCTMCRRYFIREEPRDRYCSRACSKQAMLRTKRDSWGRHGSKWRK
jgi:hypothetical protein